AERARGKGPRTDDEPCVRGRVLELRTNDSLERQVSERAAAVPTLVALHRLDTTRSRVRVELLPRLEPLDAGEPVAELPPLLRGGELVQRDRLPFAVRGAQRAAGVNTVDDLARRSDRAVEPEIVRDVLHDLLQGRTDDVHLLAARAMALHEVDRLVVDQGTQH